MARSKTPPNPVILDDGLGNPIYDPEHALLVARGIANGVEEYTHTYYAAPGVDAGPPIAPKQGAGFRVLETDVWQKIDQPGSPRPTFILLKSKGETIDHEFAEEIGVSD
jgi:hypothetical protein